MTERRATKRDLGADIVGMPEWVIPTQPDVLEIAPIIRSELSLGEQWIGQHIQLWTDLSQCYWNLRSAIRLNQDATTQLTAMENCLRGLADELPRR